MGDRVQGFGDGRELIARDLRLAPQRNVVRRGRRREEERLLLGLKVFERAALRATVASEAVVSEAPLPASRTGLLEGRQERGDEVVGEVADEAEQTAQFLTSGEERLSYPLNYWNGLAALIAIGLPLMLQLAAKARPLAVRALISESLG